MNNTLFNMKAPELNDDAVAQLRDFLYECLDVFEARDYYQLQRHHRQSLRQPCLKPSKEEEDPF